MVEFTTLNVTKLASKGILYELSGPTGSWFSQVRSDWSAF